MKGKRGSNLLIILFCLCVIVFMVVLKITGKDKESVFPKEEKQENQDNKYSRDDQKDQEKYNSEDQYLDDVEKGLKEMDMSYYQEDAADTYEEYSYDPEEENMLLWENAFEFDQIEKNLSVPFAMLLTEELKEAGKFVLTARVTELTYDSTTGEASWIAVYDGGKTKMNYSKETKVAECEETTLE